MFFIRVSEPLPAKPVPPEAKAATVVLPPPAAVVKNVAEPYVWL